MTVFNSTFKTTTATPTTALANVKRALSTLTFAAGFMVSSDAFAITVPSNTETPEAASASVTAPVAEPEANNLSPAPVVTTEQIESTLAAVVLSSAANSVGLTINGQTIDAAVQIASDPTGALKTAEDEAKLTAATVKAAVENANVDAATQAAQNQFLTSLVAGETPEDAAKNAANAGLNAIVSSDPAAAKVLKDAEKAATTVKAVNSALPAPVHDAEKKATSALKSEIGKLTKGHGIHF